MSIILRDQCSIHRGVFREICYLLIAVSFIATSKTASATCGDYLAGINHRPEQSASTDNEHPASARQGKTVPLAPRCSGPACGQPPLAPMETPQPDHVRSTFEDLCDVLNTVVANDGRWSRLGSTSNVSLKSPDRDRLNRPPQFT